MSIYDTCGGKFEYDEGQTYDSETFVCFECLEEVAEQSKRGEPRK